MNYINSEGKPLSAQKIKSICVRILTTEDSARSIAKACRVSVNSVIRIKSRISELGITQISEITSLSNDELGKKFYPGYYSFREKKSSENKLIPDFKHIALKLLETKKEVKEFYDNYEAQAKHKNLETFSFKYFCFRVKNEIAAIKESEPDFYMAQSFPYGMYVQVDFTGDRYKVKTFNGTVECSMMVLCWPASYYVYAEFVTAQSTAESCRVLGNAFKKFDNRVPSIVVVDNARCFVTRHSGSEAIINRNFEDYLQSMNICVEANPPYSPQSKSAVEYSVRLTQKLMSSIKGAFNETAKTLPEHNKFLNAKIEEVINKGPFRKSSDKTRYFLFREYELPSCLITKKIPVYQGDLNSVIVPRSYLITVNEHDYSVPFLYIKKRVDVYTGNDVIIIKYEGKEIARHKRTDGYGKTIVPEHCPAMHQNIIKNNSIYSSTDDILRISKTLDDGVYRFCASRIKHDETKTPNALNNRNTINCCRAVINKFKRSAFKDLYSEACTSTLALPPELWNSYKVNELYEQVVRGYQNTKKVEQGHQTELFRPAKDEAHIRSYDDDLLQLD